MQAQIGQTPLQIPVRTPTLGLMVGWNERFGRAAWRLLVDHGTIVVTEAFEQGGIRAILLKGPALSHLYPMGEARAYSDTDLLIAEADLLRARSTLQSLGYRLIIAREMAGMPLAHAETWSQGQHLVDLHVRLPGARSAAANIWRVLSPRTKPLLVRGHRVETLDDAATALLLTLHVFHHGPGAGQPYEDLRRGLQHFDRETWNDAARLAHRLGEDGPAGWGLRAVAGGSELATDLGLPAPQMMRGFREIILAQSPSAAAQVIAAKLFPSALELRAYGAGPGRHGVLVAWFRRWRLLARQVLGSTLSPRLTTLRQRGETSTKA